VIEEGGRFTFSDYPTRRCVPDDFVGLDYQKEEAHAIWNGIMILCPDKDEAAAQGLPELSLLGDPAAMEANAILFDVRRCMGEGCAPDLENYIKDIQIDSWIVFKKMNFTDRLAEPTFTVQDVYDS
jgi:hypothetical protein